MQSLSRFLLLGCFVFSLSASAGEKMEVPSHHFPLFAMGADQYRTYKIKDEFLLINHLRKVAKTECKEYFCGNHPCQDVDDFEYKIAKETEGFVRVPPQEKESPVEFIKLPPQGKKQVFFTYLRCTSESFDSIDESALEEVEANPGRQDASTWSEMMELAGSDFTYLKDKLHQYGVLPTNQWALLKASPVDTLVGYGAFFASGFPMGNGLSNHLSKISESALERAKAAKSGIEHSEMRRLRLQGKWEEAKKNKDFPSSYNDTVGKLFDMLERHSEKTVFFDRIEAILNLPTQSKQISKEDLEKLYAQFEKSNRSSELIRAISDEVMSSAVGVTGRNLPYLIGPPGIGKTSIIKETAEILGLPYCVIKLGDDPFTTLFGNYYYSGDKTTIGMFAKCLTEQYDPNTHERLKVTVNNPIIFFDELDKTMDEKRIREFFLAFFNNDENSKVSKLVGLNEIEVDLKTPIYVAAANGKIAPLKPKKNKDALPQPNEEDADGWDLPIKSRLVVVEIPPMPLENKKKIGKALLKKELSKVGISISKEERDSILEKILEEDNDPGVRVIKSKIKTAVAHKKGEILGYKPYQPKKEKTKKD
jgi:hypothetical protein